MSIIVVGASGAPQATGVAAGTYTSVTVDVYGRVTAGSNPAGYTLPVATASVLGGVKIGSGISVDGDGVISASAGYTLPNATTTTLGGVIVGTGLSVSSGTVSLAAHASTHQTGGSDAVANVVNSPSQITANQNDYTLPSADIVRLDANAARDITGFTAGTSGQSVLLVNVGTNAITLKHQNTSSTAANRIVIPWAGDYVLDASGGSAVLVYDSTTSRWRVLA